MIESEVVIVGTGLFGCIIGRKLQERRKEVFYIDSSEQGAASKAAACLIKPSWISGLGKEVCDAAFSVLHDVYSVKTIEFETGKLLKAKVKWVNPREILVHPDSTEQVNDVDLINDKWILNSKISCQYLIIAAGIWCNKILHNCQVPVGYVDWLSPRTGAAFIANGLTNPKISSWRPYRQLTAFNIRLNEIWTGDSEGYKIYGTTKLQKSQDRCANFIAQDPDKLTPIIGHRPYVPEAKPCYLKEHAKNLWVVTGGAKNGTIAAGWAAHKIAERLC